MSEVFINLPEKISTTISAILAQGNAQELLNRAEKLHLRYMLQNKDVNNKYIGDYPDVLAYLALRASATFAQISGALLQIKELMPLWKPRSLLDIGSGPGTAVWAANSLFPSIKNATCIDANASFISAGKRILNESDLSIDVLWQEQDIAYGLKDYFKIYDLIIISNVLNELTPAQSKLLLEEAYEKCNGILLIIEPGTPVGFKAVEEACGYISNNNNLLAPYINSSFVQSKDYWVHFSQRFIRSEFLRRIRQRMRNSSLMASDCEEAKYSYVAFSKISAEKKALARCIGPVKKYNGYLEVSILTEQKILNFKVLKRNKSEYSFAKNLHWGDTIADSRELASSLDANKI